MQDEQDGGSSEPRIVRMLAQAGRMSWQFVGIAAAVFVLGRVYGTIGEVLLAVFTALVVAAAVSPVVRRLEDAGMRRSIAAFLSVLGLVAVLGAMGYGIVLRVAAQGPELAQDVRTARQPLLDWLEESPLQLSREEVAALLDRSVSDLQDSAGEDEQTAGDAGEAAAEAITGEDPDELASDDERGDGDPDDGGEAAGDEDAEAMPDDQQGPSPTLAVGVIRQSVGLLTTLGFVLLGFVLAFFLVRDRATITEGVVRNLVGGDHDRIAYVVIRRSWAALLGYVRASLLVGLADATVIGVVLFVVGVPLAGVLTLLTFLAAFVPVVGAVSVGLVSVAIALVSGGLGDAAIVATAVFVVQQLDGQVLQPVLMRYGTGLHPAATILALTIGGILGGVLGALLAVPTTAVVVAAAAAMLEAGVGRRDRQLHPPALEPDEDDEPVTDR